MNKYLKSIVNYFNKIKQYFIKEDLMVLTLFLLGCFIIRKNTDIRYPTATLGVFLGYLSKNVITSVWFSFWWTLYFSCTMTEETFISKGRISNELKLPPLFYQKINFSISSKRRIWISVVLVWKQTRIKCTKDCSPELCLSISV